MSGSTTSIPNGLSRDNTAYKQMQHASGTLGHLGRRGTPIQWYKWCARQYDCRTKAYTVCTTGSVWGIVTFSERGVYWDCGGSSGCVCTGCGNSRGLYWYTVYRTHGTSEVWDGDRHKGTRSQCFQGKYIILLHWYVLGTFLAYPSQNYMTSCHYPNVHNKGSLWRHKRYLYIC